MRRSFPEPPVNPPEYYDSEEDELRRERARLARWCDECGEKRPCTCDKEADAHIAEQEEEEYLRTQKLEEERAKAPCENCGKKLCKCDERYELKIENEMRRYEE